MNAIELMMDEHKNIKEMLKVVRKACFSVLEGEEVNYEDFYNMIHFIRNYADSHHHKKEEIMLFNRMVDEIGETAEKVVKYGMLVEHDLGRLYVTNLNEALEALKNGNAEAKLDVIANAVSYTNLLERHIHKEDNVIYKFAQRELKKETVDIINEECVSFEDENNNVKDENLEILKNLKEKYCI
ncbi:hemerythrin domain-containing protein [Clostridium tertium]|jgi:hemerythrin-like domain-containing protein|uniref:hemerythrin domain-containing protein n=1 Tax=Clostridium TaxID=1485 RepID=UPI000DD04014|nr:MULTISPECIES: hemerythrin domain-containing protein [Clostridium]MBS5307631.1 hemerythrin domain-containing protein [Clostridium sp.]MDB1923899.1 hemerythrin domain-containing protein [Clostridium tertium]MDB1926974.1 hemerythrin domain-containing protein [Clostridium tertium]MDB1930700.1 hemerythrin domain-containing protein [Clostridium tertium]MDB1931795.1 hemerythrin domain-containing protein [Clostridium tertium]